MPSEKSMPETLRDRLILPLRYDRRADRATPIRAAGCRHSDRNGGRRSFSNLFFRTIGPDAGEIQRRNAGSTIAWATEAPNGSTRSKTTPLRLNSRLGPRAGARSFSRKIEVTKPANSSAIASS